MALALYRKYRPLVFRDVIGQSAVTDTLRRQIAAGKTSHAYLFTGTRGTGKTTCAKILARAVNCEHPTDGDPCNECAACRSVLDGGATDVLEMDAASHSGVDNIRALREEFVYAPVSLRRRVYIIDEVHMLSTGAFNALLKSMEEPPEHVLFILATTETHKVPATILSRCQRFAFKRLSADDLTAHILSIAGREGIDITPDAASLLAHMSDGAARDALSLLDQCAALSDGFAVDTALVHEALGLAGTLEIAAWIGHMADGNAPEALSSLDTLYRSGKELSALLDAASNLLRDVLMAHMLSDAGASPRLEAGTMRTLAAKLKPPRLISMIEALQETQQRLPRSVNRRVEAELCILRLCGMPGAPSAGLPVQRVAMPVAASAIQNTSPIAAPPVEAKPPSSPPLAESASYENDDRPPLPEEPPPLPEDMNFEPAPPVRSSPMPEQPPKRKRAESRPEPIVNGDAGDIMERIRGTCQPIYRMFLGGASTEAGPGGLILYTDSDFSAMNLKTEDFTRFLASVHPGPVQIRVREPDSAGADSLDSLLENAGSLITLEE